MPAGDIVAQRAEDQIEPPLPTTEFRRLVCHDDYLSTCHGTVRVPFPFVDPALYRSVFDFGCGCGRVARQLLVQEPSPEQYGRYRHT